MKDTRHASREPLRVGSSICECAACGERFRSPTSFDKHRTGSADARRCLTLIEMVAEGMSKNERGLWIASVYDREIAA